MEVIELRQIQKKDLAILYRREFTAVAAIKHIGTISQEKRVSFSIEHLPVGGTSIKVTFQDKIDYPLVPAIKSMKSYIANLEREGRLA